MNIYSNIKIEKKNIEYFIGIDTGKYGGIVVIDNYSKIVDFTIIKYYENKGDIDLKFISEFLSKYSNKNSIVCIESTFKAKKNINNFQHGRNSMAPESIATALNFNIVKTMPIEWKSNYSLNNIKINSINMAKNLSIKNNCEKEFIKILKEIECFDKRSTDGVAEAYLIANFCMKTIKNTGDEIFK